MKIIFSTMPIMANNKTKFIYFIILPICNILLITFLQAQYSNEFSFKVAYATVVITAAVQAANAISSSFIYEKNQKISQEIAALKPLSNYFWLVKIQCAIVIAYSIILINYIILYIVSGFDLIVINALFYSPLFIFSGIVLGFFTTTLSINARNPYFWPNILYVFMFVFSGVLVEYDKYPITLKWLCYIFPFSHTVKSFYLEEINYLWIYDFVLSSTILILLVVLYRIGKITLND
ncbi:MAG: ABC transporter permease [Mycoplasmatales bacterium]